MADDRLGLSDAELPSLAPLTLSPQVAREAEDWVLSHQHPDPFYRVCMALGLDPETTSQINVSPHRLEYTSPGAFSPRTSVLLSSLKA